MQSRKDPKRKSEALEQLVRTVWGVFPALTCVLRQKGDWMWSTPDRTGTLNRKEGSANAGDWQLNYCVLQVVRGVNAFAALSTAAGSRPT